MWRFGSFEKKIYEGIDKGELGEAGEKSFYNRN